MRKEVVASEVMYNHVRLWQQSGQSQKSYCQQAGIAYHVFHYWYHKYRHGQPTGNSFIQLSTSSVASSAFAECYLSNGVRIVLHQPVHADYLKTLAG